MIGTYNMVPFVDPCSPDPCAESGNATVQCESLNAISYECNYKCLENHQPIGGKASSGCLSIYIYEIYYLIAWYIFNLYRSLFIQSLC